MLNVGRTTMFGSLVKAYANGRKTSRGPEQSKKTTRRMSRRGKKSRKRKE